MERLAWKISQPDKGVPWIALSIMTLASWGIAAYFFTRGNSFGAVFFAIAPIVFGVSSAGGTENFSYEINEKGIRINNKLYEYDNLRYFAFVEDELVIKPKKAHPVHIYIVPEDAEKIRENLSEKLKEKEHTESFTEMINRFFNISQ